MKRKKNRAPAGAPPIVPALTPTAQLSPLDHLAMLAAGATDALRAIQGLQAWKNRLETYRRLYPDRYAHVVAFTDGIDDPTPEQCAEILARAAAAKAA